MGRLFWKFFAFVWLAQLIGIIAVASLFWLTDHRAEAAFNGGAAGTMAMGHGAGGPGGALLPPPPARYEMPAPPTIPLVATLAASILTALALAGYVAKPIRSLREAFEAVAAGDLDRRITPRLGARHDELADLGRDFDRMASRLQASMHGQRRLLHDVSHQLRSPLARLQAAAGLIRQNPDQIEAMVARIEEEIARIDRLVGQLLTLSRLEARDLIAVEEQIDMRDLVRDIVHDANFEAQVDEREVIWDDRGSATVQGHPELLHRAIENIVRNALKHAPESRIVRVETSVDAAKRQYILRVSDDGRGVPQDELPDLFTPFFRGSRARSDGYGLGLPIARRSVEACGGTIRADNRAGGGLAVEIVLAWHQREID